MEGQRDEFPRADLQAVLDEYFVVKPTDGLEHADWWTMELDASAKRMILRRGESSIEYEREGVTLFATKRNTMEEKVSVEQRRDMLKILGISEHDAIISDVPPFGLAEHEAKAMFRLRKNFLDPGMETVGTSWLVVNNRWEGGRMYIHSTQIQCMSVTMGDDKEPKTPWSVLVQWIDGETMQEQVVKRFSTAEDARAEVERVLAVLD